MTRTITRIAMLFLPLALLACGSEPKGEAVMRTEIGKDTSAAPTPTTRPQSDCRTLTFEGSVFTDCVANPQDHRITTTLNGKSGQPMRSLTALTAERPADAPKVAFAINGGMFDDDGQPIGYYVQSGKRIADLNRADGPGNFHLLPNGVFFGSGSEWQVRTADNYYAKISDRPDFGTQSGPMLVIEGKLHPEITENGPSRKVRNAVGIDERGLAHFVISTEAVSFGRIARLFRDELRTPNALFLDGSVSALWDPATGRLDSGAALGPMIVVEKREGAGQ